jgi:predicted CXXCH cytochrome family protein
MRRITLIILAIILTGNNVYSLEQKPVMEKGPCFSLTCHIETGNEKFVHGPVFEGKCEVCHMGLVKKGKGSDTENCVAVKKRLFRVCISCHENIEFKQFVHWPMKYGECTACHNPHGSENKFQLVSKGSDLCFQCHDKQINMSKYKHGPSAMGECLLCHDPHSSDYKYNLKAEVPELCSMCHEDQYDQSECMLATVTEKCTECHNPHSSPTIFMLSRDVPDSRSRSFQN